jgi:lipopolysaccharide export system permease protein
MQRIADPMNLIERYIFRRAGFAALLTLGTLVGVVWIIQALRQLDFATTQGQSAFTYLLLTTLAIPGLVLAIIPIGLLLATVYIVNAMNANSELVVINTSGASSLTLARPLLLLALLCSLITGAVGHYVAPLSLLTLKIFAAQARADLVSVLVREGQFTTIEKGLVFHVARKEAGGVLSGILIADDRDPAKSLLFTAEKGAVTRQGDNAFLVLRDGQIQQQNSDSELTNIRYDSYVFDLSTFARKVDIGDIRPKERPTGELLNPNPDDPYFKQKPGLYRAQIHERFSEMLWPFAYVLVMLGFAGYARSSRQGHGSAIGTAMLAVTVLRWIGFSAISALRTDPDAVALAYGLPVAGIALGTWLVFANKPVALPRGAQARFEAASAGLQTRLAALRALASQAWRRYGARGA